MTETPCSEHTKQIAVLEQLSNSANQEVTMLRKSVHDINNSLSVSNTNLRNMNKLLADLTHRLEHHMDAEEAVNSNIYQRLKSLDNELKQSFKERDERLNNIEKTQVKYGAYMAIGAFGISIVVQYIMRILA